MAIGLLQGFGYYTLIKSYGLVESGSVNGIWAGIVIVLSFTAGSAFLMWLGEQITEFGIGNGISIILFAGIVSRGPHDGGRHLHRRDQMGRRPERGRADPEGDERDRYHCLPEEPAAPWVVALIVVGMLALVIFIVFISNAERRLPVQYAKRVVGRKMYGGQSTHIPMKVNMSGVMPIIFAQSIASLPATIGAFTGATPWILRASGAAS